MPACPFPIPQPQTPDHPWYPGELDVWRMLPDLTTSEFAERHREVTLGQHKGRWDNTITPYLVGVMNAADLPWVHEIDICGPEQSGKTNACINIHLKDLVYRPGNVKYPMLPKEGLARKIARDRLIPIYRACAPIAGKLSSNPDDTVAGRIAFRDGTVVYPIWGTSPSEISSFPSDFTWGDEIDKNDDLTGDESDALKLLEKRSRTFRRFLNLRCSTPTLETGHIWRAVNACSLVLDYPLVCPHCGHEQVMREENLTWPGQGALFPGGSGTGLQPDADPKAIAEGKLARYRCDGCAVLLDDIDRDKGVRLALDLFGTWHGWRARGEIQRQESWGFLISGFVCPDISLSDIAAKIIAARSGDVSAEKERDNSFLGIPHRQVKVQRKEDVIYRLCDDRPEGLVPSVPIAAITCVADMQKRGFWYTIRAWGYGLEQESWLLKSGFVDSWEALRRVMFESQFEDVAKNRYIVTLRGLDSGGGEGEEHADLSRTAEAYLFAVANPGVILFKGRRRMARPYNVTDIDRIPGTNKPLPGSAKLYTINTTFFKDKLAGKLMVGSSDPGAWHLHSGYPAEQLTLVAQGLKVNSLLGDFAQQMCAEYRTEHGVWECPKNKANHLWDCSQMEQALVEIAQVKMWPVPATTNDVSHHQGRRVRSQGMR